MADRKKASTISLIASRCGLGCMGATIVWSGSIIAGAGSGVLAMVCFLLGFVLIPLSGLAGIALGIIALCQLTPEEKRESFWTSGTTKNCALPGIIVPPLGWGIAIGIGFLAHAAA